MVISVFTCIEYDYTCIENAYASFQYLFCTSNLCAINLDDLFLFTLISSPFPSLQACH